MPQGFYLIDADEDEVLMPRAYITDDMAVGDERGVFVYGDASGRDVATTEAPYFTVNQYALLEVRTVNRIGAFCDWGTSKELLVPYSNQVIPLKPGYGYVVHMYLDEQSGRLVGTTKLNDFLVSVADEEIEKGKQVDLLVIKESEIGYNVVVDQKYSGLVYKDEVFGRLQRGQSLTGYVKPIRPDGKIDVSLDPIGHKSIGANEQLILDALDKNDGYLPFTDKSFPDRIREEFGISKKLFKKVLGSLYKQKMILLKEDGIYKQSPSNPSKQHV